MFRDLLSFYLNLFLMLFFSLIRKLLIRTLKQKYILMYKRLKIIIRLLQLILNYENF